MRNTFGKLAWAAGLISTMALGDGPPPEQGLYLGPQVGTNFLTLAWPGGSSYGTGFAPGVRATFFLPSFAVGADLGLSAALAPFGGDQLGSLNLGGEVMPYLMRSGSTRAYGLLGLNVGVEPSAVYAHSQLINPKAGLTLGIGLQHSVSSNFVIGAEAGARAQILLGLYRLEPTTSVFISFIGQWGLGAPPPREKVTGGTGGPGTTGGPASSLKAPPPRPAPPNQPAVYGRSTTPCTAYASDGWFEPTQGVWQDDPSFEDKPHKQLTRLPGDAIAYEAELNMVKNRDTLLFGVHHYRKGGELVSVNDRNDIVLMGYSNCTVKVPVKFKFTQTNPVETREIYTSPSIAQIPLDGPPASDFKPWTAVLPVPTGVPSDKPFRFDFDLSFQLKAELIRESGAPTGLQMTVNGYAQPAVGPKVQFVPVMVNLATNAEGEKLYDQTDRLAANSAKAIPDLFPIPPDGLPTFVKPVAYFDEVEIPAKWGASRRYDALVAALNDNMAASTFLDGAGRVVVVMRGSDYKTLFGDDASAAVPASFTSGQQRDDETERWKSGRSLSWKVMAVPSSTAQWDTVAHELLHTLPEGWSGGEMQGLCGRDYHNRKDPVAHGVKIDDGGTPAVARETKDSKISLMGPEAAASKMWITQCAYWHLLGQLGGAPSDPPVVMLRAWIGKDELGTKGELKAVYNLMGHADLAAERGGPFAFVLKDAKGVEMARYPFTPRWNDIETRKPRELVSVVYRVPDLPGWKEVELVGPGGVLDRRKVTSKAPELVIKAPADSSDAAAKDGKIHVAWQATGESGAPLLYSVSYSSDGGYNWVGQSFEQKGTTFELKVDPKGTEHQVKIVVTDGTRSVEAVTRFTPKGL